MQNIKPLFLILIFLFIVNESFALPRYSLKLGDRCESCHVNPTGGNMRNLN